MEKLREKLINLLRQAGVTGNIEIVVPPDPEMGDFGFATFGLARERQTTPFGIAAELKEAIEEKGVPDFIESIEAVGPYLNFFLKVSGLSKSVIEDVLKAREKYGGNRIGGGRQVLVEYSSNNTHKELHVGHLRNICIGNALTRIFSSSGFKTVSINYINDFGAHVAKCLWGFKKFHENDAPPQNKQRWLGEIYAEASRHLEDHPECKTEVVEMQKKLEARDPAVWKLFLETKKWSMDGFEDAFAELGAKFDSYFFESDVKEAGQKMVDDLLRKKIAVVGEGGAIIVDLKKYGLDVALVRKSNGAGVYLTSDLGLAAAKNKKYPKNSESVYITGSEQNFYFRQLFKILELSGFKFKMTHIGYGLVNLPTGKISSRKGNVVLYDDIRSGVLDKVISETRGRHPDWGEERTLETSRKIAFGALKFDLLKHEAEKVIVYDEKSAVSFDGFTGPYVLYVVARINSLFSKSKIKLKKIDYDLLDKPEEKQLLLTILQYENAVKKALENYNPSVITKYCFDLAQQFNDFYAKHSVLSAGDDKLVSARLALSFAVRQVLQNALGLLSIDAVGEM